MICKALNFKLFPVIKLFALSLIPLFDWPDIAHHAAINLSFLEVSEHRILLVAFLAFKESIFIISDQGPLTHDLVAVMTNNLSHFINNALKIKVASP